MTRSLAVAALMLGACLPRQPLPRTTTGDWAEKRDFATRGLKLYDGLDHLATASVVHLSMDVREARAKRVSEWLRSTPAEMDETLAKERTEAAAGETFILSFYTTDPKANDLDAKNTVWRVALVVEGTDYLVTKIELHRADLTTKELFPMIGAFDQVYRLRFPFVPGGLSGRPFIVRLASAVGEIDLDYGKPPGLPPGIEAVPPSAR